MGQPDSQDNMDTFMSYRERLSRITSIAAFARRSEVVQVSAIFLTLLCIFFWRVVFRGQSLLAADLIYGIPFFESYAPEGFRHAHNGLLYDQIFHRYPWRKYTVETLARGRFPLWNPFVFSGVPFIALYRTAVLDPLNLVLGLLPLDAFFGAGAFIRLFIAGLSTFLFLRRLEVGRFGSLVSAISFTFSGFLILRLVAIATSVAIWLPFLLLLTEILVLGRDAWPALPLGIVLGMQLLGGHPETSFHIMLLWISYCGFRIACNYREEHDRRAVLRHLGLVGLAFLIGLGLAAIQLLPFYEWLQQSDEFARRTQSQGFRLIDLGSWQHLASGVSFAFPNIFNNPTWEGTYFSFLPGYNFVEQNAYIGVLPLLLALSALPSWRKRIEVGFFAGMAILALGMTLHLPLFTILKQVPLFSMTGGRVRLVYTFCAAVLAGIGAHDLLHAPSNKAQFRRLMRLLKSYIVIGTAGLVSARLLILVLKDWIVAYGQKVVDTVLVGRPNPRHSLEHYYSLVTAMYSNMLKAFSISNVAMYFPILIAVACLILLFLRSTKKLNAKAFPRLLVALIILDLFAFGMDYNATVDGGLIYPETAAIRFLERDDETFRIMATRQDMVPNVSMVYHLADVRGPALPLRRYARFTDGIRSKVPDSTYCLFLDANSKLVNLLNVKYIITASELEESSANRLSLVYDKEIKIYENSSYLPRSFMIYDVFMAQNDEEALRRLADPSFDPGSEIILEEPLAVALSENPHPSMAVSEVEVVVYQPELIELDVYTFADGLLFFGDAYYPGWKAYVDGVEEKIYVADYTFRAVYVAPGRHRVQFVYEPFPFKIGALISLTTISGLVLFSSVLVIRYRAGARN